MTAVFLDEVDKTAQTRCATMRPSHKLRLSTYELPQSEIAGHWIKIAIVVEQRRAIFNAPGADQEVDCLADCDPAPT